ncbi:MAG: hypothetical protein KKF44_04335 [Nanoarchaeota archaeon]|nr:hypothetical protein [Nanoarchaeota archaeon]
MSFKKDIMYVLDKYNGKEVTDALEKLFCDKEDSELPPISKILLRSAVGDEKTELLLNAILKKYPEVKDQ